jgi:transcription elongation GreA/GreB family factor
VGDGSVITIQTSTDRRRCLFGDRDFELRDGAEAYITPTAPVGRQLKGKAVGDVVHGRDGTEVIIVEISGCPLVS